jgi:hypothetical protein
MTIAIIAVSVALIAALGLNGFVAALFMKRIKELEELVFVEQAERRDINTRVTEKAAAKVAAKKFGFFEEEPSDEPEFNPNRRI